MAEIKSSDEDIFLKLKSSSSSVTYDALQHIRYKTLKTQEGVDIIRKYGALEDLVNFLHKPNEKILDVTLSILGNCCLNGQCANEVVTHGILTPLTSILNSIEKDSIQCRACRLVGNLARDPGLASQLLQKKVAVPIACLLDADVKSSTATRQMAVRALRMLWCVEDHRSDILACKGVRLISSLLPIKQDKRENQELLQVVIKALAAFSYRCSDQCAHQIIGDGTSLKHIMPLVENASMKQSVLNVLCNLCYSSTTRPALGNAGFVQITIQELSHLEHSSSIYGELVQALCYLCNESVNRAKIKEAGGLPLLQKLARSPSSSSLQGLILHALMQFMYDDIGLQELLREGLVVSLVSKIADFVKEHGRVHKQEKELPLPESIRSQPSCSYSKRNNCSSQDEHAAGDKEREVKLRFRANSPSYQAVVRERDPIVWYSDCSDCFRSWSPGSPGSITPITPDSSLPLRGRSPLSDGLSPQRSPECSALEDEFDYPEVYSPICCNGEEESDEEPCESNPEDVITPLQEFDDEDSDDGCKQQESSTGDELGPALILLSRVSHMDNPVEDLAAEATITTLLDYVTLIENPQLRARRILYRIVSNHHYFMILLLQRFVLTLDSRLCQPLHSSCWKCSDFKKMGQTLFRSFSSLADSGFGEGELAYQLLKADDWIRKLLAVSIPYIVSMPNSLWKLMVECQGLNTLVHILDDDGEDDRLASYVPASLKQLASSLDVPNPKFKYQEALHRGEYPQKFSIDLEPPSLKDSDEAVSLLLDDGSSVKVSKSDLSEHSPMFEAMFRGGFKESSEDEVSLPGISRDCLLHVLHMMKLGRDPPYIPSVNLATIFELAAALDRFLIPCSKNVTEVLLARFLLPNTAVRIYSDCVEAGNVSAFNTVRLETLRYMLTKETETLKLISDVLQTRYKQQVLLDVTDILLERLQKLKCIPCW